MISQSSLRRALAASLLAASIAATAAPAAVAQSKPTSVRLDYQAAYGCPPVREFVAEVRKRLHGFASDSRSVASSRVRVTLSGTEPGSFLGELRFDPRDGSSTYRHVEGATCEEVAQALAVVISIVLEPSRASEPPRPSEDISPSPRPAAPPTVMHDRARSAVALEGGATSSMAPRPAWYGQVLTEVRWPPSGDFQPLMRFGTEIAWRDDVASPEGVTSFRRLDALLEVGAVRLPLSSMVALEPVVGLAVGGLRATGSTPFGGRSRWTAWVAPNLAGRLLWSASDAFKAGLCFAIEFPVVRNRFYLLSEESTVFQVPVVGARAGASIAYRFP